MAQKDKPIRYPRVTINLSKREHDALNTLITVDGYKSGSDVFRIAFNEFLGRRGL